MKVTFRQNDGHNCGLYAVANATNSAAIITAGRLQHGILGQSVDLLNQYLREDGAGYHVEVLYKNIFGTTLPGNIKLYPELPHFTLPMMLGVQLSAGGLNHMVAIHALPDRRTIYVYDSLKEEVTVLDSYDELSNIYPVIFAIYAFCDNDLSVDGYKMLTAL